MKKILPIISIILLLFTILSCDSSLQPMEEGDVNYNIYPYLEFELSYDSTYYIAYVVEGAKITSVTIPGEKHTDFGSMPVKVFGGFTDPEDAVNLKTVYIDENVDRISEGAFDYAYSLERVITTGTDDGQNWAKLPPSLTRDGYHFHGWKVGDTIYDGESTISISPDAPVAQPYFVALEYHEAVNPTCTEEGSIEHWKCPECGKLFTDSHAENSVNSVSVSSLGHLFPLVHKVAVAPTCQTEGKIEYWRCDRCLGLFSDDKALNPIDDPVLPIVGHSYEEKWFSNTNEHWHECKWCHSTSDVGEHSYGEGVVIKEPTEQTKGTMLYTCTVCGKGRNEDIPELDHEYLEEKVVPPTCTTEGYTEHKCIHCGEVVTDNYVPALGHIVKEIPSKSPTCVENGNIKYYHCSECGGDFRNKLATEELEEEDKVIEALGHDFPQSWNEDSVDVKTHFRICLREGCGFKETALHVYDQKVTEGHIAAESTCQHPNQYYVSCVCGKNGTETFTSGEVGAHSYTKFVYLDYQYHQKACKWCGTILADFKEEHVFKDGVCTKCEYEVVNGSGGITPIIKDKRPQAHLEYERNGLEYRFTLINDKEEYPPTLIEWYLDDRLQEETEWTFSFDAPNKMTYKVLCVYSSEFGKGSQTIVVNGG